MEKQANTKCRDFIVKQGDLVLLKLQPYRQTTVNKRVSQKLSKRFFEQFKIIKYVEEVAYMLDLPSSSRVHRVNHVSHLKLYYGDKLSVDFLPLPLHDNILLGDGETTKENTMRKQDNNNNNLKGVSQPPTTSEQRKGFKVQFQNSKETEKVYRRKGLKFICERESKGPKWKRSKYTCYFK